MILGWLRGPSRSLGINLETEASLAFEDDAAEAFSPSVRRSIVLQGTLLHERSHWLHFVGTTSGVFHVAVWETQALATKELVTELGTRLSPDDFPLSTVPYRDSEKRISPKASSLIGAWFGLRDLHHWFFGNQFTGAIRPPTRQALELFSRYLSSWLIDHFPGPGAGEDACAGRYDLPSSFGDVSGVSSNGTALGFHQLTECAARLSEFVVMQYFVESIGRSKSDRARQLDVTHLFEGVYGLARRRFFEITHRNVDQGSEAILSVLIHESLNAPLPPLSPASVLAEPWIQLNPYGRFLSMVHMTKAYRTSSLGPVGLEEYTGIREDIRATLLERGVVAEDRVLSAHARRIFGGSAEVRLPSGLYEVIDGRRYPVDHMRYRYLGRLFYEAFSLYDSDPVMIAFPGLYYVSRPQRFRELFAPIRPPIMFVQNEGYRPTWEDPAAHAVLLLEPVIDFQPGLSQK